MVLPFLALLHPLSIYDYSLITNMIASYIIPCLYSESAIIVSLWITFEEVLMKLIIVTIHIKYGLLRQLLVEAPKVRVAGF